MHLILKTFGFESTLIVLLHSGGGKCDFQNIGDIFVSPNLSGFSSLYFVAFNVNGRTSKKQVVSFYFLISCFDFILFHQLSDSVFRYAVVTGANKGIGFEICRQLALNGVFVVLTARDEKRGVEAVEKLKESGFDNVIFHQLDVADAASIHSLAEFIRNQFGKLDILV